MKLGVLLNDLGPSQVSYLFIRNTANWLGSHSSHDVIGFYADQVSPCIPINFSVMQMNEAWDFHGRLIATNLQTARRCLGFPGTRDRWFYVWDLEWLRPGQRNYRDLAQVYRNPNLKLIARSEDHRVAIEDAWNRSVEAVIPDFNMERLCLS